MVTSLRASSTKTLTPSKALAPRLGVLLQLFRTGEGESAKTVSRRCALGPVALAQLELGRADMSADELGDAVAAYAVPRVVFPERHCQLGVDLAAGSVSVRISDAEVEETAADRILLVYFELIFESRQMSPTTPIPFTALDLDVLRVVLSSRRDAVTRHLESLVGPSEEQSIVRRRIVQGALLVLAAGAIATGIIALRDAQHSSAPPAVRTAPTVVAVIPAAIAVIPPATAGVPIKAQIIEALVIERGPSVPNPAETPVDQLKGAK